MQKSFVAITLVLTLTCVFAAYTHKNYAIAPVSVVKDDDYNFTNTTRLTLTSITPDDLHLVSGKFEFNFINTSATDWKLWYKKLDTKSLATVAYSTASIIAPMDIFYYNNYAVGFDRDYFNRGISQITVYQVSLTNGAAIPRFNLSTNTNPKFTPTLITFTMIKNTVYIFYLAAAKKLEVTNFVVGSSAAGTPKFTLSTTFDTPRSLSVAWGKSLGSNQLFAVWVEKGVLKDSVLDVRKGTVSRPTTVLGYKKTQTCVAYATDKKLYGELCYDTSGKSGTIAYYVRTTKASLVQYANYRANDSTLAGYFPYGQYLAVFFSEPNTQITKNYAYEIWNLDSFKKVKDRTFYLHIDGSSLYDLYRAPSGGIYTLLYNNKKGFEGGTFTSVKVGLLLEGYPSSNSSDLLIFALLMIGAVLVVPGLYYYRKKLNSARRTDANLISDDDESRSDRYSLTGEMQDKSAAK